MTHTRSNTLLRILSSSFLIGACTGFCRASDGGSGSNSGTLALVFIILFLAAAAVAGAFVMKSLKKTGSAGGQGGPDAAIPAEQSGTAQEKSVSAPESAAQKKPYIQWNDNLSVKIREIDEQHRNLVVMINELYEAMEVGKGKDVLESILNKMIQYVGIHFATEEQYMTRYGYPDQEKHEAEHRSFVQKALEFQKSFQTGKLGLSIEVMAFLKDWLVNHIMGTDRKYSSFFNEKGLK